MWFNLSRMFNKSVVLGIDEFECSMLHDELFNTTKNNPSHFNHTSQSLFLNNRLNSVQSHIHDLCE